MPKKTGKTTAAAAATPTIVRPSGAIRIMQDVADGDGGMLIGLNF